MVADAIGVEHDKFGGRPRIVSLVPSITELLFALGLGAHVVGRTPFCIHPKKQVEEIPCVGGTKTLNTGKIMAVAPTHILLNIDENKQNLYEKLAETKSRIIVTHPTKVEDNLELYDLLAYVFSCERNAETLKAQLISRLKKLRRQSESHPSLSVLYLIWKKPWMTISKDTYIASMLSLINMRTLCVDSDSRYPSISDSVFAKLKPNVCMLSSEPFPFKQKHIEEVNNILPSSQKTILVNGEMLSWYGNRAIAGLDYLENLASRISEVNN